MNRRKLGPKLREEWLANGGRVSIAALLDVLVPVPKLRELAQKHGLSPKGFRIDTAPAKVLVPLLAEHEVAEVREDVCDLLGAAMVPEVEPDGGEPAPASPDLRPLFKLRESELREARGQLDKCRAVNERLRRRGDKQARTLQREKERVVTLRAQLAAVQKSVEQQAERPPAVDRDLWTRTQALERELDEQSQIEQQHRMKAAEQAALLRERDERIAELEELVPKGRQKKRKAQPPAPPPGFIVPHFTASFLKSLQNKDRRSIEHAYQAVFLYCAEGPRYPGLQVKSLEPSNVWSLRASRRLRVYFRPRPDGDADILELIDRQEQDKMLRNYREK